ncbi:MAG TPA: hypothetical protein VGN23_05420 [Verrucomicrobiae bacterium]
MRAVRRGGAGDAEIEVEMRWQTEMKPLQALKNSRFASCEKGARMLITLPAVCGRSFISVSMKPNLIRDEIFRGKYSPRQDQLKQSILEERTLSASISKS